MIFITLGSQKFQFNRLLKAVDDLVEKGVITDKIFAQSGYSDYKPVNYNFKRFMDRDEYAEMEKEADIIITHGGTGAIIGGVKRGKKVIAVPRRAKYGEHVDDHQLQLVKQFDGMKLIEPCWEVEELETAYCNVKKNEYAVYISNTDRIIASIEGYLNMLRSDK